MQCKVIRARALARLRLRAANDTQEHEQERERERERKSEREREHGREQRLQGDSDIARTRASGASGARARARATLEVMHAFLSYKRYFWGSLSLICRKTVHPKGRPLGRFQGGRPLRGANYIAGLYLRLYRNYTISTAGEGAAISVPVYLCTCIL